jgi:hypothetical protein
MTNYRGKKLNEKNARRRRKRLKKHEKTWGE